MISHFLLGSEIHRLMEIIKQYEQSLRGMSKDLERSQEEKDELLDEIDQMKRDKTKVGDDENRSRQTILALQKNIQDLNSKLDEEVKRNYVLNNQLTSLTNQLQSKPKAEPAPEIGFNMGMMDFLNDDKNSLVQQLVRRNLENDKLRREIEFLKIRMPPINTTTVGPAKVDSDRAKDLLKKIGDVFYSCQEKNHPLIYDLELIKIKTDGLIPKVDQVDNKSQAQVVDRTNTLMDSIKNLHSAEDGIPGYEREKEALFKNIEELLKKILNRKVGGNTSRDSGMGFSPLKALSNNFGTVEDQKTEIINGVPVKVKYIRRTDQTNPDHNNLTLNIRPELANRETQQVKSELGKALKRIGELENQNQLLLSKIDKYILGTKQLNELQGDVVPYNDAPTSNIVAVEELRAQVFGLKNEINDYKLRLDQSKLEGSKFQQETDELKDRLDYHVREVENLKKREQDCNNQIIQANNEKNQMSFSLKSAETDNHKLKAIIVGLEERVGSAEKELKSIEKNLNSKLNEALRKVDEKESQVESLKRNLSEKQSALMNLERKHEFLQESHDKVRSERDELEAKLLKSENECEDLRNKVAELVKEVKRMNEELAEMDGAIQLLKNKIVELQSQKEAHLRSIDELKKNVDDLVEELVQTKSDNTKLKGEIEQKNAFINELTKKLNNMTAKMKKLKENWQQFLTQYQKMNLAVQSELLEIRKRIQKEKEDQDKYIQSIALLLQTQAELNPKGTLNALIQSKNKLNEIPKLISKINSLDNIVKQKQDELIQMGQEIKKKINDVEGDLQHSENLRKDLEKEIERKDNTIASMNENIKKLEDIIPKIRNDLVEVEKQKERLIEDITRLKKTKDDLYYTLDELKQENKQMKNKVEKKENQTEKLIEDVDRERRKNEEISRKLEKIEGQLKEKLQSSQTVSMRELTLDQGPPQVDFFIDKKGYTVDLLIPKSGDKSNLERQSSQIDSEYLKDQIKDLENNERTLKKQLASREDEIDSLKSKLDASKNKSTGGGDRAEILKEKIETLLGKIEVMQRNKFDVKMFNELADLKKKYFEVNKKSINEYISICQQSLDLYEKVNTSKNT